MEELNKMLQFIRDFEDNGFNIKTELFKVTLAEEFDLNKEEVDSLLLSYKKRKHLTITNKLDKLDEVRKINGR